MQHRTYLWLHLIFDVIEKRSASVVKKKVEATARNLKNLVEELPSTVDEAYEEMLRRSVDPEGARRLLQLIVGADRPLSLNEVNTALALDTFLMNNEPCTSEEDLDAELYEEGALIIRIKDLCGLLVNISDSKLYLIHQTARDFLLREERTQSSNPEKWKNSLDAVVSETTVARICISYLMLSDFSIIPPNSPSVGKYDSIDRTASPRYKDWYRFLTLHPLLDYSANHWAHHFEIVEGQARLSFFERVMELCDVSSTRFETWYQASKARYWRSQCPLTALEVAASFGLDDVVMKLLQDPKTSDQEEMKREYGIPLFRAAEKGYQGIVELLLKEGAEINSTEGSALSVAANNGHVGVVRALVEHNPTAVNVQTSGTFSFSFIGTPVLFAARRGYAEIVQLLLNNGAVVDIEGKDEGNNKCTALSEAAKNGHKQVVEVLLAAHANVNLHLNRGSALEQAASAGVRRFRFLFGPLT
jgi:hypothetical protein